MVRASDGIGSQDLLKWRASITRGQCGLSYKRHERLALDLRRQKGIKLTVERASGRVAVKNTFVAGTEV